MIEQVRKGSKTTVYITCDGERYEYDYETKVPIGDFINILRSMSKNEQYYSL